MPDKDESAWLIERNDRGRSEWFTLSKWEHGCPQRWSSDSMDALRFAREIDARNAFPSLVPAYDREHCTLTEHVWCPSPVVDGIVNQCAPSPPSEPPTVFLVHIVCGDQTDASAWKIARVCATKEAADKCAVYYRKKYLPELSGYVTVNVTEWLIAT